MKLTGMKKGLYSLGPLTGILLNANKRFLKFISDIVDPSVGIKKLKKVSRTLKRLHTHGMVKKVAHTYKYYLTRFGSQVITMGMKLKTMVIIPELARAYEPFA